MTNAQNKQGLAEIFEPTLETQEKPDDHVQQDGFERAPSWFHHKDAEAVGDAMHARYLARKTDEPMIVDTPGPEAYQEFKRKLDERFAQAQRLYDNPAPKVQHPTLPISDIHGRRRLYQQEEKAHVAAQSVERSKGGVVFKMISLGAIAMLVGGSAGLAVVNYPTLSHEISKGIDSVQASISSYSLPPEVAAKHNTETVITKKTVAIASLEVSDVRGTLNSMIPLMLNAQVAEGNAPVALKVMGLPPESYLTKGIETTKGTWFLKPEDIAGVKLVVPQIDSPQFDVEVAAVEPKTGILAAPIKALTVEIADSKVAIADPMRSDLSATIAPANSPPDNSTQSVAVPVAVIGNAQSAALISKGDELLSSGDIASARQFYLKASELGDGNGDYGVGRTYDPTIYAALNVQGLAPDTEKAALWYKKAKMAGVSAARTALETLQATK